VLDTGPFERDRALAVCRRAATLAVGPTVLEIGANIGTKTVHFIRSGLFDRVIYLEPDPRNLMLLSLDIEINKLDEKGTVVPAAAVAAAGMKTLRRDAGNSGGATLRSTGLPREVGSEVAVRVVPIDRPVDRGEIDPDRLGLIWMGAAGFDAEILSACTRLLSRRTPAFYDQAGRDRVLNNLFSRYPSVSIIGTGEFHSLTRLDAQRLKRRTDLFCC